MLKEEVSMFMSENICALVSPDPDPNPRGGVNYLTLRVQFYGNAGINFIHNHPPAHPRGFAPKIFPHLGAFAS